MRKILLIDDEYATAEVMKSLRELLMANGFVSTNCDNITDAARKVKTTKFDIIITDMMLSPSELYTFEESKGGINTGYLFLKDLVDGKFGKKNRNATLVVYTNHQNFSLIKDLKQSFPNIYLVIKPFKSEIIEIIKSMEGNDA